MPWWYGPGGDGSGWNWVDFLLVIVSMVVFWGGLITVVLLVLRHPRFAPPWQRDAERILADRLARGEIDNEEYRSRLAVLGTRR
ncbi:SHOCT domain-containing protein [Allokutzneria oryzae]|uniref:SHOCT domain-containing protein n=1 Tax=Allokutzneria oryzae TaxID=1378989 RepID=A0ABV5ZWY5_9PSEU